MHANDVLTLHLHDTFWWVRNKCSIHTSAKYSSTIYKQSDYRQIFKFHNQIFQFHSSVSVPVSIPQSDSNSSSLIIIANIWRLCRQETLSHGFVKNLQKMVFKKPFRTSEHRHHTRRQFLVKNGISMMKLMNTQIIQYLCKQRVSYLPFTKSANSIHWIVATKQSLEIVTLTSLIKHYLFTKVYHHHHAFLNVLHNIIIKYN